MSVANSKMNPESQPPPAFAPSLVDSHFDDGSTINMLYPFDPTWIEEFVNPPPEPHQSHADTLSSTLPQTMQALHQAQSAPIHTPIRTMIGSQFLPKNVGFFVMTNTMVVVDANNAISQHLGLPLDHIIGAAVPDIAVRSKGPQFSQPFLELLLGERSMLGTVSEMSLKHNGRKIWVRTHLLELDVQITEAGLRHFFGMMQILDSAPPEGPHVLS